MKNKIISGIIAALSLPVYFSLLWAIDQFLLVRIVLVFVMIACMIVSVYKLSKLILDEHFKKHDKRCMGHRTKRILRIERKEYQTY